MQNLHELCGVIENMIDPIIKKGDITPGEMDTVYKGVKTIMNIETIKAMREHNNEYSERNYYDDYSGRRYYMDDMSGNSYRQGRDAMGRYTSNDNMRMNYSGHHDDVREYLNKKLVEAKTETERNNIMDMINKL